MEVILNILDKVAKVRQQKLLDYPWKFRDNVTFYFFPEVVCPHCLEPFPSKKIWLVEKGPDWTWFVRRVWDENGKLVPLYICHPHVDRSGYICMGSNIGNGRRTTAVSNPAQTLFTGLGKGHHYSSVESWLLHSGHICNKLRRLQCWKCLAELQDTGRCPNNCFPFHQFCNCSYCHNLRAGYGIVPSKSAVSHPDDIPLLVLDMPEEQEADPWDVCACEHGCDNEVDEGESICDACQDDCRCGCECGCTVYSSDGACSDCADDCYCNCECGCSTYSGGGRCDSCISDCCCACNCGCSDYLEDDPPKKDSEDNSVCERCYDNCLDHEEEEEEEDEKDK